MSIVLTCDAPGCPNTAKASVKENSHVLLHPPQWWINPGFGRIVVACSLRCVNSAVEASGRVMPNVSSATNQTTESEITVTNPYDTKNADRTTGADPP